MASSRKGNIFGCETHEVKAKNRIQKVYFVNFPISSRIMNRLKLNLSPAARRSFFLIV